MGPERMGCIIRPLHGKSSIGAYYISHGLTPSKGRHRPPPNLLLGGTHRRLPRGKSNPHGPRQRGRLARIRDKHPLDRKIHLRRATNTPAILRPDDCSAARSLAYRTIRLQVYPWRRRADRWKADVFGS